MNAILERISDAELEEEKRKSEEEIRSIDNEAEELRRREQEDEKLVAIAHQASERLGYNVLQEHLQKQQEQQREAEKDKREAIHKHLEMMDVLGAFNTLPFKKTTVEAYKKAKMAKEKRRQFLSRFKAIAANGLCFSVLFSLPGACVGGVFYWLFSEGSKGSFHQGVAIGLGLSLAMGLLYAFSLLFDERGDPLIASDALIVKRVFLFLWHCMPLKNWSKPIPIPILQTALQINERLPGAKFFIEELKEDPFLIAHYGDRDYYIAVWDEPGFEARPVA